MAAAWSYWPARSSSKPWPIAWAGSGRTTSTERISPSIPRLKPEPNTTLPLRAMLCRAHSSEWEGSLPLRCIQPPEILEHQPTLLGGETLELLPPGVPEPRARARRARLQDVGDVHAVSGRGPADALLVLVGLVVRERAAGVEQSAVQPLLALDGLLVEAPGLELACELLRLLRERTGGGVRAFGLEPRELLRQGALAGGETLEPLQHGFPAQPHQRQQALGQTVQPLLITRQARQLLHCFGKPAPRLPTRHLAAAPGERQGRGVQRVDGVVGEGRRLGGVGVGFFELGARRRHLSLRIAQRRIQLRRHERVLPGRLADLACHRVGPLLHCRLPRPGGGARFAAPQRVGDALLSLGERGRLRERPVERRQRLAAPLPRQRVTLTAQRLRHARELLLSLRPGFRRGRGASVVRRLRGALHRRSRRAGGLLRRRERRAGARPEVRGYPLDAAGQGVRTVGERALPRRAGAVRPRRVLAIPLGLTPLQVLGVGRERRQRALDGGPAEQLLTALELGLELLLRLCQALERTPRRLRIEPRERLLQLPQPRRQFRRHRALQQILDFTQPRLERRVAQPGGLCGARDLFHRARQLLNPLLQRLLLARDGLRALRRLEGKRSVPRVRRTAGAAGLAGPLLRQVPRPRPQLALRLGERLRRGGHVPRRGAGRRAQLLEARQPQRDLRASPHVSTGGGDIVPRLDAEPQRVAGQQPAPFRIEIPLNDGPLTRARHIQRLAHGRPLLPRLTHPPAHHLEASQTVIVPCVDHEGLLER